MKIGSTKGFITQPFKKGNKFKKKRSWQTSNSYAEKAKNQYNYKNKLNLTTLH